jgi:BirA family biotin operon repressor/biotin-[acetyl-CoA-carboxylase] ligase
MSIGSKIVHCPVLPSTNTYAAEMLRSGRPVQGTVIQTNYQSAGRGHGSATWESEEGKNLLISIILYPARLSPSDQFLLSMAVSLGICDFLERYTTVISIKWPNDIYVKNDKIAGILIESSLMGERIEYSIAGIGLNINQEEFLTDAPNPVSLGMITGNTYDLAECLSQLLSDIDTRYQALEGDEAELLITDYHSRLYMFNRMIRLSDAGGIFRGRITGVTRSGSLLVEREEGKMIEYSFKEVEYII